MIRILLCLFLCFLAEPCRAERDGSVAGTVVWGDRTWEPSSAVAYQHLELLILLFSDQLPALARTKDKRSFAELDAERHCAVQRCLRVYLFDPQGDGNYQVLALIAQNEGERAVLADAGDVALAVDWAWFWDANAARGTLSSGSLRLAFEASVLARKWDGLSDVEQHFGEAGPGAQVVDDWLDAMAQADDQALLAATDDPLRSRLQAIQDEIGAEHRGALWTAYADMGLRTQLSRCHRANDTVHCELRMLANDGSRWRSVVRQAPEGSAWRIAVLERIALPDLP